MEHYPGFSRMASWLLATVTVVLTLAVVANATQAITTPNVSTISYSLGPGGSSAAITAPGNQPVLVMGVNRTTGNPSLFSITLLRVPSGFLEWEGLNAQTATMPAAIVSNSSNVAGTHIVYLDLAHTVDLKTVSADTFVIHNANGATQTGVVKLIW